MFSAGNSDTILNFPASLTLEEQDWVCAVSAVDLNDSIWWWSNRGWADLVAPAGDAHCYQGNLWTLDQMGDFGINPTYNWDPKCWRSIGWDCDAPNNPNYNCKFSGTSSACPIVAGVGSLLWGFDTSLRKHEVYSILRHSAVTHLDWDTTLTSLPDSIYGYGRVDAFRAILSVARGNVDNDPQKGIDISDITALIDHLYISLNAIFPSDLLGDVDCDGRVDISDLTRLIDHLFINFTPLQRPCFAYGD